MPKKKDGKVVNLLIGDKKVASVKEKDAFKIEAPKTKKEEKTTNRHNQITTAPKDTELYKMTFFRDNEEIGKLDWEDGVLKFEGKAEESAKLLFDFLKGLMDEYLKERRKKNDQQRVSKKGI